MSVDARLLRIRVLIAIATYRLFLVAAFLSIATRQTGVYGTSPGLTWWNLLSPSTLVEWRTGLHFLLAKDAAPRMLGSQTLGKVFENWKPFTTSSVNDFPVSRVE